MCLFYPFFNGDKKRGKRGGMTCSKGPMTVMKPSVQPLYVMGYWGIRDLCTLMLEDFQNTRILESNIRLRLN